MLGLKFGHHIALKAVKNIFLLLVEGYPYQGS
jgi:hypothetical protein